MTFSLHSSAAIGSRQRIDQRHQRILGREELRFIQVQTALENSDHAIYSAARSPPRLVQMTSSKVILGNPVGEFLDLRDVALDNGDGSHQKRQVEIVIPLR